MTLEAKIISKNIDLPRPLRPTKRRSLNLATWFFITAVQFRSSPHQLSSFPARIVTIVPSPISLRATTLNATGSVLFERQWFGRAEHRIYGLPVRTVINFKIMAKKMWYYYELKITQLKLCMERVNTCWIRRLTTPNSMMKIKCNDIIIFCWNIK